MIKTDTFELHVYDSSNALDYKTIITLFNDEQTRLFLGNVVAFIENVRRNKDPFSEVYIAALNGESIGLISLNYLNTKYEICYAILPEKRKQGLASLLLGEFTEYVFNNTNIKDLYLYINTSNKSSLIVAYNNDYIKSNKIEYKRSKR